MQDAIAAAIENNLDLEVDRYGPLSADWPLQRAPRRAARCAASRMEALLVNQATSGQGVAGSQAAAGLSPTIPQPRAAMAAPPSRRSDR